MKKHSAPSSPTKRSQETAAKKKLPAHGSNVPQKPPGPYERSPARERTRKIPPSTELIPQSDIHADPKRATPVPPYIPEDVRRELDAAFPGTQSYEWRGATQPLLPPPSAQPTANLQSHTATTEEPPHKTQPHGPGPSTSSAQETTTLLQGIRSSTRLQERVEEVTQRAIERIKKKTRQWLSLQANEFQLTQLKDDGRIPKTMRAEMPIPQIRTLGVKYCPSDTMRTTWETAHLLLFEEFLAQHHDALIQTQQELADMLPKLEEEDFLHFQNLILQAQDDILSTEVPSSTVILGAITTAFRSELESAFMNFFFDVRAAMVDSFNIMKKRSASVRQYLQRHNQDAGMDTTAQDEPLTPAQQIEDLTSQLASLRASLSDTRNQLKQMKTQKRGGQKNDTGRTYKSDRTKVAALSNKRSNKDTVDKAPPSFKSKNRKTQSGPSHKGGQSGSTKPKTPVPQGKRMTKKTAKKK